MGAGRKTSTYDVDTGAQNEHARWRFESQQRLLGDKLGGVIFGRVLIYIFAPIIMRYLLYLSSAYRCCTHRCIAESTADVYMQCAIAIPTRSV